MITPGGQCDSCAHEFRQHERRYFQVEISGQAHRIVCSRCHVLDMAMNLPPAKEGSRLRFRLQQLRDELSKVEKNFQTESDQYTREAVGKAVREANGITEETMRTPEDKSADTEPRKTCIGCSAEVDVGGFCGECVGVLNDIAEIRSEMSDAELRAIVDKVTSEQSVLRAAEKAVYGERRDDYGTPEENHTRTAAMWSAYLGHDVTPTDVCMLNILQKVSRGAHKMTRDTLVDIAGYAENAHLVRPREQS